MNGLRKILGLLLAVALTALALPASADSGDRYRINFPTAPVATGQQFNVTIANRAGFDTLKSFTITAPAGVSITAVASGSSNIPSNKITNAGGTISVSNIAIYNNQTGTLTVTATFPASCTAQALAWTSTAKGGWIVNNEVFTLDAGNSNLTTNVAGGSCTYSLTGDSSVAAGSSSAPVSMTLTNNAPPSGPAITSITVTPPAGVTIVSPPGGVVTGLNVAGGTSTPINVTVSTQPSCTTSAAASWSSSVAPATFSLNGANPKTTITAQTCSMSITAPTSAAKGAPFSVTVNLTSGPGGANVMLTSTCGFTGAGTTLASGYSAVFTGSVANAGSCTFNATADKGYPPATALTNFTVFAAGDLNCNSANYSTSAGTGTGTTGGPLDPDADEAYVGDPAWGLRRYGNLNGVDCTGNPVNYTLTTGTDDSGKPITNLAYDKGNPPQAGNFKYVIVWPSVAITPWPELRPDVAWIVIGGVPQYVPGLACLSDNASDGSAVMPVIPNVEPFISTPITDYQYDGTRKAKMCIAQVGWTPVGGGLVQFWTKVIDQADGYVKGPT